MRDNTAQMDHEGPFISFPLPSHAVPFFVEHLGDKEKPLRNIKQVVTQYLCYKDITLAGLEKMN